MALLAHCVSYGVNALYERPNPYSGSGVSEQALQLRFAQADRLARATGLDMVEAGWRPTVGNYLGTVTKSRILEAVREGAGEQRGATHRPSEKGRHGQGSRAAAGRYRLAARAAPTYRCRWCNRGRALPIKTATTRLCLPSSPMTARMTRRPRTKTPRRSPLNDHPARGVARVSSPRPFQGKSPWLIHPPRPRRVVFQYLVPVHVEVEDGLVTCVTVIDETPVRDPIVVEGDESYLSAAVAAAR